MLGLKNFTFRVRKTSNFESEELQMLGWKNSKWQVRKVMSSMRFFFLSRKTNIHLDSEKLRRNHIYIILRRSRSHRGQNYRSEQLCTLLCCSRLVDVSVTALRIPRLHLLRDQKLQVRSHDQLATQFLWILGGDSFVC